MNTAEAVDEFKRTGKWLRSLTFLVEKMEQVGSIEAAAAEAQTLLDRTRASLDQAKREEVAHKAAAESRAAALEQQAKQRVDDLTKLATDLGATRDRLKAEIATLKEEHAKLNAEHGRLATAHAAFVKQVTRAEA
jgi:chromosome segregation ATPase